MILSQFGRLSHCAFILFLLAVFGTNTRWADGQATRDPVPPSPQSSFAIGQNPSDSALCRELPLRDGWTLEVATTPSATDQESSTWQREVLLPAPWESLLGNQFDGKGTFRRTWDALETQAIQNSWESLGGSESHQLLIRFQGVATEAVVTCNGVEVGRHTGGWTPWECDLSDVWSPDGPNQITVEVDEKVGHHTQGFLPIVAPHFGGIWKEVSLSIQPHARIVADRTLVLGDHQRDQDKLLLEIVTSQPMQAMDQFRITVFPAKKLENPTATDLQQWRWEQATGEPEIHLHPPTSTSKGLRHSFEIPVTNARIWDCDSPWLYDVQLEIIRGDDQTVISRENFRTGIRSIATQRHQLLLNGKPINVRGLLNWGYSPPSTAPTLDRQKMLDELLVARRMNSNLMKFCLYVPPQGYLEMCDALGVLAWMEYPTWHAQLTPPNLDALSDEYREFTWYDRNHPSVVLRSLTCETGSSADLEVIRSLYNLVHQQVPNCVVEDDSSWISWNRVSDFWDDHPYGNNHTWVATLERLKDHIRENGAKPLILGEAIAADTWPTLDGVAVPVSPGTTDSQPVPDLHFGFESAAAVYQQQVQETLGESVQRRMQPDSIRYAGLMRKYQIETYRREVPWGGFVVSEIRDFPLASMGLVDPFGHFKFTTQDATQSIAAPETTLLLQTENDRRSFDSGSNATVTVLLATPDAQTDANPSVQWATWRDGHQLASGVVALKAGDPSANLSSRQHAQTTLEIPVPDHPGSFDLSLAADDANGSHTSSNRWRLWSVPATTFEHPFSVQVHSSARDHYSIDCLKQLGVENIRPLTEPDQNSVILARHWDRQLWDAVMAGHRVLMLPDGQSNSFATADHWFLRGGPVVNSRLLHQMQSEADWLSDLLVDLQHFDLAGPVQTNFDFWQSTSPWIMLWDTHDIKEVKTHGLVWLAQAGKGRIAVTMLNHDPDRSAVGPWLLAALCQALVSEDELASLPNELLLRVESELATVQWNLTDQTWRLRQDPDFAGLDQGWHLPGADVSDWDPIRIDAHWEGQGQDGLDGWAWYATRLTIPDDWNSDQFYLCFTGVDDHYRAFVNGKEVGSAGVIETRETAFEMRSSYRLPDDLQPGDEITIRIAVYDWYGAGGIFRPMFLRTTPLTDRPALLKP